MGGGGSQLAASIDPSLKAVIGLCPWLDLNGFEPSDLIHDVPVLIFTGENDDIANSAEYGYMHYQGTPSTTDKLYFEIANVNKKSCFLFIFIDILPLLIFIYTYTNYLVRFRRESRLRLVTRTKTVRTT